MESAVSEDSKIVDARYKRLENLPLVSYRRKENAVTGFFGAIREVFSRRELLGLLVRRELVGRYKDSTLGLVWSMIRPLTQLLIYYLVMGEFLGAARNINNFAIFIFSGLTIYGLFSEIVNTMTSSIVANSGLIKKVYLPREIFPIAAVGAALVNFGLQMIILLVAAALVGTIVFGANLLFSLLSVLIVLLYAVGVGLFLAAWNVYLRDIQFMVEVIVMLLMWFSPIVYSWTFVADAFNFRGIGWLTNIYINNPVTLAVLGFQKSFWADASDGIMPDDLLLRMGVAALIGVLVLWWGQRVFSRLQPNFAQEL